jgi:hypothetical protein
VLAARISGCSSGDGGDGDDIPSPSYSVTVTVNGLVGSGLQLQNGADTLAVRADGAVTFATKLPRGARYSVTVLSQPAVPAQVCEVEKGEGTIAGGDFTDVGVTCVTSAATRFAYAVNYAGGSISIYNVDTAHRSAAHRLLLGVDASQNRWRGHGLRAGANEADACATRADH